MHAKSSPPAELDAYFRQLETDQKFSGVVRLTRNGEEQFAAAYGYASRAWKIPNSLSIRFDTASITKLFTSVAVLQQVQAGHFDLHTSAVEYLGLKDTAIAPQVQVHHLLTHTSGIADDADEEAGESYAQLWATRPNYSVTQAQDFLPQFAFKPANFPPGTGCRYCNCAYILLGLMLEKATQTPYREYIQRHIFAPAQMDNSDFFHMGEVNPAVAEGSDPIWNDEQQIIGWHRNIYDYPPIGTPDGGAHVTAADLERFLRSVQEGQLLSAEMTQYFFTPQALHTQHADWKMMYGPGLWFYLKNDGEILFYEKEGENAGVSGLIRHYPAQGLSLVLLCNLQNAAWQPADQIHHQILSGQFK